MDHLRKNKVYKNRTDKEIHQKLGINAYFISKLLIWEFQRLMVFYEKPW